MAPQRRLFDPPVVIRRFIETDDYNKCHERTSDASVVVCHGPSGYGKTMTARQVIAKLCSELTDDCDGMYAIIKATDSNMLNDNMRAFLSEHDITLDPPGNRASGNHWNILLHFIRKIQEKYPNHKKYFMLDDATGNEDFLDALDDLVKWLRRKGQSVEQCWKVIVTTCQSGINPRLYKEYIGQDNFVKFKGFSLTDATSLYNLYNDESNDQRDIVKLLYDQMGRLPLAMNVAIKDLDITSVFDSSTDYVQTYLGRLRDRMERIRSDSRPISGSLEMLAACELSIERCVDSDSEFYQKFIRMLSGFDEADIPGELLKACAETLMPLYPDLAASNVGKLMAKLRNKGLCTTVKDASGSLFFTMHALVKTAMKTVFHSAHIDLAEVYTNALIALTRVIPKDGRQHNPHLPVYYFRHGESLKDALDTLGLGVSDSSMVMFLQCDLYISLGYCLIARKEVKGEEYFRRALDKYSLLVTGESYEKLLISSSAGVEVTKTLYEKGQVSALVESPEFEKFIDQLTEFHVFPQTFIGNMMGMEESDLVNRHLSKRAHNILKEKGMVLQPGTKLARVYMGEMLGHIYFAWSKVFSHLDLDSSKVNQYIQYAKSALTVYDEILREHKVYLLPALIAERTLIKYNLEKATTCDDADRILQDWIELSQISNPGQPSNKDLAYEYGLQKSRVSEDKFHNLFCKEGRLCALGMKYKFTEERNEGQGDDIFQEGRQLYKEIILLIPNMAGSQRSISQAMSKSHQHFAKFLHCCDKFDLAVKSVIHSMHELRQLPAELDPAHISFHNPYSMLKKYYDLYLQTKVPGTYLLTEQDRESEMVRGIIKAMESCSFSHSVPFDHNYLSIIEREEIEPVQAERPTTDDFNESVQQ